MLVLKILLTLVGLLDSIAHSCVGVMTRNGIIECHSEEDGFPFKVSSAVEGVQVAKKSGTPDLLCKIYHCSYFSSYF